jgi:RNA polymerase sigma factor (sigma-70 family)
MDLQQEMSFASRLIKKVAQRMVGKASLLGDDVPDLQQDLWLHLLEHLGHYRADRGHPRAFITRVVKNKAASILAARAAAKRGGDLQFVSLDEEFEDEDGEVTERHETISVDDYLRRTRGTIRSEEERRNLAIDMRRMADRQPSHCLAVCMLLIDRDECDVANVVGLPRSTLRDLIKRLRASCAKTGLRKYCE